MNRTLCYLATPYSKFPGGLDRAFEEAARIAAELVAMGYRVFSPIAHTHPLAKYGHLDPYSYEIWLPLDEAMMERSDILIVCTLEDWENSKGIQHEIDFFAGRGCPIFSLNPVTMDLRPFYTPPLPIEKNTDGETDSKAA